MQQSFVGGSLTSRGPGALLLDVTRILRGLHARGGHRHLADDRGVVHECDRAGPRREPGLPAHDRHRRASIGVRRAGYARRGGLYALSYETYLDSDETYSFDTLKAEVVQHMPILRENWVISLHGVARTTLDESDDVPYFLLPSLGSGSTLRAYPSWRFRDRHSLLMSGEWRWIPSRMLIDMAIFYDAGKVAGRREDLNFKDLKHDWGVGFRLHTPDGDPAADRRGDAAARASTSCSPEARPSSPPVRHRPPGRTAEVMSETASRASAVAGRRHPPERGGQRAADDAARLPAARRLLPLEDGARGADPHRGRRGGEELLVRRSRRCSCCSSCRRTAPSPRGSAACRW